MNKETQSIVERYDSDKTRLMDMLWDVQNKDGYISNEAVATLAEGLEMSDYDVRETLTFYHFFHDSPTGTHKVYLSDTIIARMNGYDEVLAALEQETGCSLGTEDGSGTFGLYPSPCIGLSEQEPAMLVDKVVFSNLTPAKVTDILTQLKQGKTAEEVANPDGHAKTDIAYVNGLVSSEIIQRGSVFFKADRDYKAILKKCLDTAPDVVIDDLKTANVKGLGGAGFSTGMKWSFCRAAEGSEKYILCNADEGEPGTFKDRAILTHSPKDTILGMIIGAHAIGDVSNGILYLRCEYWYLKDYLEQQLQDFRDEGLLGKSILGSSLDFDIRIQMGAGAYICGDETSLIESCEGKRGSPRVKPPFPAQSGYLSKPTSVNNVETLAVISRVIEEGADWFKSMGTGGDKSSGSRLLSISGDVDKPGIYEIEWGATLNEVLALAGAKNPKAAQISGPAGECLSVAKDGDRKFCFTDLSCNGSLMVFDESRDILQVVKHFMDFFVEESCGICTPCRAGGVDMRSKIDLIIGGRACQQDLDEIQNWGNLLQASRCALGTTTPKPLTTTIDKFPEIYEEKLVVQKGAFLPSFDYEEAMSANKKAYEKYMGVKA